jgi:hypothetical protein
MESTFCEMVIENRGVLSIRASRLAAAGGEIGSEGVGWIRFCGAGLPEGWMAGALPPNPQPKAGSPLANPGSQSFLIAAD